MTDVTQDQSAGSGHSLRTGSLGVAGVAFFVLASIGPMSAVVGGVPLAIALGPGPGVTGLFVVTGVLLLLFSVAFTAMSHRIVSAGGFYEYVGVAFGRRAKRAAGFVALFSYYCVEIALFAFLAATASSFVVGWGGPEIPWQYYMLVGLALVAVLGYRDVNLSARLLGVLTLAEFVVILVLNAVVILKGGAEGFRPRRSTLHSRSPATSAPG